MALPVLEKSACVLMDVLGFVERQKASFQNGAEAREFEQFYKIARREGDALNTLQKCIYNSSWRAKFSPITLFWGIHCAKTVLSQ